ncbi:thioredoxin domain-containing protein [Marinoscillum sp. MHG1-6]|uniref:thioredoxin domain-containing protein n=1 Tax=Marinoscillum sp. MHG1-6 TaxID=2959627 RepID=UPI0021584ADD|nr:thioredoxin domain-containing protein [Marinoscillum sp. MHG1-6]
MNQASQQNHLKDSTSPYLLQHAHQPVDWFPWGHDALQKAQDENKPILLSIGYSSCHWCHVMAHESFDDHVVAEYMNNHFVNIKLDREERPDIDSIYMDAIQAMGLRGGWPLNIFLTPDQKPFYGGTYFPKENWIKLLQSITQAYDQNFEKLNESAEQFAQHIQASDVVKYGLEQKALEINDQDFNAAIQKLVSKFDLKWGGLNKAPKFPMPCVWEYLAHYAYLFQDEQAQNHFLFTLDKIAEGGIYDQIGGGFARYSVDGEWHVPHFEKMLYDNGQLMSLYAKGYKISGKEKYKQVLINTAEWLKREMTNEQGGFYSALDADSEGVEGKFYVWSYDEILELALDDANIITRYYDVSRNGNWEGTNVLRRLDDDETFSNNWKLTVSALNQKVQAFNKKALFERNKRIKPGLDDKIISGWNGLMLSGLLDAYQATGNEVFPELAKTNAAFIKEKLINSEGQLLRLLNQPIEGFLEDYGAIIQAFVLYYETLGDQEYLSMASTLCDHVIGQFYHDAEKLFHFTSRQSEALIARKKEIFDNVIPSSNALMAENLFKVGTIMDREDYKSIATAMVRQVSSLIAAEPEYMSYWSKVALLINHQPAEVVILSPDEEPFPKDLLETYLPNAIKMMGQEGDQLPLLSDKKVIDGKQTYYVCFNKTCQRPTTDIKEALKEIALSL